MLSPRRAIKLRKSRISKKRHFSTCRPPSWIVFGPFSARFGPFRKVFAPFSSVFSSHRGAAARPQRRHSAAAAAAQSLRRRSRFSTPVRRQRIRNLSFFAIFSEVPVPRPPPTPRDVLGVDRDRFGITLESIRSCFGVDSGCTAGSGIQSPENLPRRRRRRCDGARCRRDSSFLSFHAC